MLLIAQQAPADNLGQLGLDLRSAMPLHRLFLGPKNHITPCCKYVCLPTS